MAVLDDKRTAGRGIVDVVEARLHRLGRQVSRQSYVAGERGFRALLSRMEKDRLRVAYIGGYHTEVGLLVRQAAEAKADLTVMANDPLMTSEFWAITGSAGNGTLFTFMPNPAGNANAASAVAGLKASGLPGEGYTLYACAAVQAWAEAVNRSGSSRLLDFWFIAGATVMSSVSRSTDFHATQHSPREVSRMMRRPQNVVAAMLASAFIFAAFAAFFALAAALAELPSAALPKVLRPMIDK
ncbi:hypothetical protein [Bradyrhizobium japonicum]|uniref:hypothetical protein n=1 Tax=Bradyrhizobium japonicum TaxID=375 RepID=UPI003F67833B